MTDIKLKIFKQIEIEIDQIEKISERIAEQIYKAAYNEAIEDAAGQVDGGLNREAIIKLKKE